MNSSTKRELRDFLTDALAKAGDSNGYSDCDSLFASGRLDSLSMMLLIVHLEHTFQIDFAKIDFEVSLIDSINDIESLIDAQ
jgi:acyl carrier protein